MIDVANEVRRPTYVFFHAQYRFLDLMFHIDTLQQDITELKDSDAELNVPAYANPVPAKVLPSVLFDKEVGFPMFLNMSKRCRETEGIIVNTFTELEFHALKSLADDHTIPKIYPVGPVLNLKGGSPNEAHNSQSESDIMRWLDDQDPSSVVFLCFGSMGSFDGDQVKELARALESCGHRFLWSLRQPPPKGNIELPKEYENPTDVPPKDFGMKEMPVMVTAEEISSGIRQLMDGSDEIKHKVKKMSEKSRVAVMEGGSSYNSLGCFIEDVIKG
ncbi:putative UDP-glucose flavonoid 3-O-glucosyltransferase 3 [Camellia lanceoleosa]|uniref:UDP-glucose flavonoid 3-O-glucosyltransferase 3 n=1 Tax=Camellia lanceoleosa TaxID=1840588 RepID=A0ACC0H8M6_9ERIC|nr:putative UDP-glucose flavonoid 3-O-glucosyltransferase 3 [Camellia lanceoleosa]